MSALKRGGLETADGIVTPWVMSANPAAMMASTLLCHSRTRPLSINLIETAPDVRA